MRKLRSTELKYFLALSLASPLALADNSGSDNFSSRVLEESLENRILDTSELRLTRTKSSVSKPALQKQFPGYFGESGREYSLSSRYPAAREPSPGNHESQEHPGHPTSLNEAEYLPKKLRSQRGTPQKRERVFAQKVINIFSKYKSGVDRRIPEVRPKRLGSDQASPEKNSRPGTPPMNFFRQRGLETPLDFKNLQGGLFSGNRWEFGPQSKDLPQGLLKHGVDPSGIHSNPATRPQNYRERVVAAEEVARVSSKAIGEFVLDIFEDLDYEFDFGYAEDPFSGTPWTWDIGRSESALVACESGSIRLTVRRSALKKLDFTFELDDCVSEGWTQDGDIEISWDDSLVDSIENPRTRWPLSASTSNYSETSPSGSFTRYTGTLQCDWVVNEIAQSVVGSVDAAGNLVGLNFVYGSAYDAAIEFGDGFLEQRDDGLTESSLVDAYNCETTNLSIVSRGVTHRILGQKFVRDIYGSESLIAETRAKRFETMSTRIGEPVSLLGIVTNDGFRPAGEVNFIYDDARWWNLRYAESVLSTEDDGSFVFAQTFQPIDYMYQGYADGFAYSDGSSSLGIDLDGDGENDIWENAYSAIMSSSEGCFWEATWGEAGLGVFVDWQPNGNGGCAPYDYFKVDSSGSVIVEDADGDGISDALDDDADNDGLSDQDELAAGSDPKLADTDGDGVNDGDDAFPLDALEDSDSDGDGVGDYMDDFPLEATFQFRSNEELLSAFQDDQMKACITLWGILTGIEALRDISLLFCGAGLYQWEFWDVIESAGLDLVAGLDPSVPIEDFGPLSFLKNAVTIVLDAPITNGAVNEISALRLLQQLALHDIPSNTNLSPIKALPLLASLTLDAGQLDSTTFSQLFASGKLSQNLQGLRLEEGRFESVGFLANMEKLRQLVLISQNLKNFEGLENLELLTDLVISTPQDIDLNPITSIALERLIIDGANVVDFGELSSMGTLSSLELASVQLTDFDFLKNARGEIELGLTELYLSGNNISDIDELGMIPSLAALSLAQNPISEITQLSKFTGLDWLSLAGTEVSDLTPVASLSLRFLYAPSASIESLVPLSLMIGLEEIVLPDNSISDIQPLSGLSEYSLVDLSRNNIRDIGEAFSGATGGQIDLTDNPLLCPSLERFLDEKPEEVSLVFDVSSCLPDSDDDGVEDSMDVFPQNPSEQFDNDLDGTGDNADLDDDDDGFLDEEEIATGTDPLNANSCPGCFSLDIDQNGTYSPLSDGLLLIRYLFGFRGSSLTQGAVDLDSLEMTAEELELLIEQNLSVLDIDGDGVTSALTDGLLVIRYLFGFSGEALTNGALGSGAGRDASEIQDYLESISPDLGLGTGNGGPTSGGGSSNTGPEWVKGEFGDWTVDYIAQCESPRVSARFGDVQGSTALENFWIRAYSFDTYLWYDEITDFDPNSDDEVLDVELRAKGYPQGVLDGWLETRKYFELMKSFELTPSGSAKDRFHFTYDTEEWERLTQSGVSAGYGMEFYRVQSAPPRQWLVAYTEPNTPASDGGVVRGLEIASIDGVDFREGSDVATLNAGLFPAQLGEIHTFVFRDPQTGGTFSVDLESQEITSTPVQSAKVFERGGVNIGYVLFNDHIITAESLLIDAMAGFRDAAVSELILDLRYNGGGFLDIARMLASMIAGDAAIGRTFSELQFNDKYPTRDPVTGRSLTPSLFASTAPGFEVSSTTQLPMLNLNRVVVISGSGTCSASESIINGLRGVGVDVVLIGDTTCGKPYGFYAIDNCGTTYFTVQFKGVNALGFGDYADGFSPPGATFQGEEVPGCVISDDLTRQLGDPGEGRLSAALDYIDTGNCPSPFGASEKVGIVPYATPEGVVVKKLPEGLIAR